jgi:hypothetical protein
MKKRPLFHTTARQSYSHHRDRTPTRIYGPGKSGSAEKQAFYANRLKSEAVNDNLNRAQRVKQNTRMLILFTGKYTNYTCHTRIHNSFILLIIYPDSRPQTTTLGDGIFYTHKLRN